MHADNVDDIRLARRTLAWLITEINAENPARIFDILVMMTGGNPIIESFHAERPDRIFYILEMMTGGNPIIESFHAGIAANPIRDYSVKNITRLTQACIDCFPNAANGTAPCARALLNKLKIRKWH